MENTGILNWHRWHSAFKGLFVGISAGTLFTLLKYVLGRAYTGGDRLGGFILMYLENVIYNPAANFAKYCGWIWQIAGLSEATPLMLLFTIVFNAVALGIIGGVFGIIFSLLQPKNARQP